MTILVDSNILVRMANAADPQHQLASAAVAKLLHAKNDLYLVPQTIYEYWVVATRPTAVNGLGYSAAQVQSEVTSLNRTFILLDETPDFFVEWQNLVTAHQIIGKNAHDAHLVAAMVVHGITDLLTFNKQDFQRFANIRVRTPAEVMAMP